MNENYINIIMLFTIYVIYKGVKQIVLDISNIIKRFKTNKRINRQPKSEFQLSKEKINKKENSICVSKKIEIKNIKYTELIKANPNIGISKIIGIGGGGCNMAEAITLANKDMYDTLIINSDKKALKLKKIRKKLYLKKSDNYGCGGNEKCGFKLINNSVINELRNFIYKDKEVYIIASLGGGVGSGSTKAIVKYLHDSKINTKLFLIKPFSWEGRKKQKVADETLKYVKQYANNIYLLSNDDLIEKYSHLNILECFSIMNQTIDKVIKTNKSNI